VSGWGGSAITLTPIGRVVREEKRLAPFGDAYSVYAYDEELRSREALIYIYAPYRGALLGLRPGMLVWILWYAHLSPRPRSLLVHPYGDPRRPLRGIFATRSPVRPNNIMLSLTRITRLVDCGFLVKGLDAVDGSPVIDVKPYSEGLDSPESVPG